MTQTTPPTLAIPSCRLGTPLRWPLGSTNVPKGPVRWEILTPYCPQKVRKYIAAATGQTLKMNLLNTARFARRSLLR